MTCICCSDGESKYLSHKTAQFSVFAVSKTTRELLLKWSDEPVRLSSEVKMPQFLVEDVIAESCDESAVMGEYTALWYCVDVDSVPLLFT